MQDALLAHWLRRYPWQEGLADLPARLKVEGGLWAHQALAPSLPPHDLHHVCFGGGLLGRGRETLSSYHLQMRLILAGEEASTQLGLTLGNFVFLVQAGSSAQKAWSLWAAGLG